MLVSGNYEGNSYTISNAGAEKSTISILSVNGVIVEDGYVRLGGASNINGSCFAITSMVSNPRAHAIERRTLVITYNDREIIVKSEDRLITMSST